MRQFQYTLINTYPAFAYENNCTERKCVLRINSFWMQYHQHHFQFKCIHTHSFVHSVFNDEYSLNIHQVFNVSKMQEKTKRWHPPYSKVPLHFRGDNRKKGIKFRISEYLISNVKPQEMKIFARICFLLFFYGRKNTQKSQQAIPIMSYLTFSMKIVLITLRKMLHAFLFIQVIVISLHWKTCLASANRLMYEGGPKIGVTL